jgi:ActR/RegA family two-component response regulator
MSKSVPNSEGRGRKGLVVDDDETWRNLFERCMAAASIKATTVGSLRDALSVLDREFFHVALVDLSLVGDENRDGIQVIRKIYSEPKEGTEAILLTAYGGVEDGAEVASLGAYRVFSKVSKGEGLDRSKVVTVVAEAAETAHRTLEKTMKRGLELLDRRGRSEEPDYLTSRIIFTIGAGYDAVNDALTDLLKDIGPLVVRPGELGVIIDDSGQTVAIDMWSRMAGQRFVALLARDEAGLMTMESEFLQGKNPGLVTEGLPLRKSSGRQISAALFSAATHDFQLFPISS